MTDTGSAATGGAGDKLDLTPRDVGGSVPSPRRRSLRNIVTVGVIGAVMAFVLYQALTSARVFFYNVDEAIERRDEIGDQTFRMQGVVVDETGVDSEGALVFAMAFGDGEAEVRHVGDEPSSLFEIGQPVVVEGHWDGQQFESSQILVKHSESYVADNPDRVDYDVEDPADDLTGNRDGSAAAEG